MENVLPESVSAGQVFPGHQNSLLRRGAFPVLRDDGSRFRGLSFGRLLQQGEEFLSQLQCFVYHDPAALPASGLR